MAILVGLSWLLYWGLVDVFKVDPLKSALVTAVVFVAIGLLVERPWVRK